MLLYINLCIEVKSRSILIIFCLHGKFDYVIRNILKGDRHAKCC